MHDRPSFDFGSRHVSIDHRSAFSYRDRDYLFVFTVTEKGVSTGYLRSVHPEVVDSQSEQATALYLINDLSHAIELRSFNEPRVLAPWSLCERLAAWWRNR